VKLVSLYDPRRDPPDWLDLLRPADCAVFLKHRSTSAALDPDGSAASTPSCLVFDRVDAARQFCDSLVARLPHLRCEIYDRHGLARPPLAVIVHPDFERREEAGGRPSRLRKLIAAGVLLLCAPLLWIAMRRTTSSDIAIFLAINCVVLALRLLYWDAGVRHREKETAKRLEAHTRIERGA
jgi:hypothetical protein